MDPIVTILRIGGVERPIGSYGLMLSLAIVVGGVLAVRAAIRARLDPGAVLAAIGFGAAGAFAGAWLLFVAVEWARTGSVLQALQTPGLVFYGCFVGGFAVLWLACRRLEVPLGRLVDVAMPAVPAAHAMGRLGCFLGGCCYGQPWDGPWAVRYTHPLAPAAHPSVLRHPVPLYESAALLAIALVLVLLPPSSVGRGRRFFLYVTLYGVVRIVTEAFRGDHVRGVWLGGEVSTSQLIAGTMILAAALFLWMTKTRARTPEAARA